MYDWSMLYRRYININHQSILIFGAVIRNEIFNIVRHGKLSTTKRLDVSVPDLRTNAQLHVQQVDLSNNKESVYHCEINVSITDMK